MTWRGERPKRTDSPVCTPGSVNEGGSAVAARRSFSLVASGGIPCHAVVMEKNAPADDPVLQRFKAALQEMYGDQIDRVVLFGSRARGEARPDSDYDIVVFLKQLPDAWKERFRLASLRVDFLDETGAFIDAKPYPTTAYRDRTPLMHEIRRDGLDL